MLTFQGRLDSAIAPLPGWVQCRLEREAPPACLLQSSSRRSQRKAVILAPGAPIGRLRTLVLPSHFRHTPVPLGASQVAIL